MNEADGDADVAGSRRADWQRFRRCGQVRARRLAEDLAWRTQGGDLLRGRAGDWALRTHSPDSTHLPVRHAADGDWTITDDEFRATYAWVHGDVYERTGTVEARRGVAGEVIETLEGDVVVRSGDWVVRRPETAAIWVVPGEGFAERYRR